MIIHGQELSDQFLDTLWDAVLHKIPANKWIEITKEPDKSVAAIKHFIDLRCYNEKFDLTLSNDFKLFRKNEFIKPRILYKRFLKAKELEA